MRMVREEEILFVQVWVRKSKWLVFSSHWGHCMTQTSNNKDKLKERQTTQNNNECTNGTQDEASEYCANYKRVVRIETNTNHTTIAWQWVNRALELWHFFLQKFFLFFFVFCYFCSLQSHCELWNVPMMMLEQEKKEEREKNKNRVYELTDEKMRQNEINMQWHKVTTYSLKTECKRRKKNRIREGKRERQKTITKQKAKTIKLTKIRLTENEASRKTASKWHK